MLRSTLGAQPYRVWTQASYDESTGELQEHSVYREKGAADPSPTRPSSAATSSPTGRTPTTRPATSPRSRRRPPGSRSASASSTTRSDS
ncbi:hypothetical protein AB6O49_24010 [Streptomyces sp. SBR177]